MSWRIVAFRLAITLVATAGATVLGALGFNELAEAVHRLGELGVAVVP